LTDMFQDMLTDDEPEAPSLEHRIQIVEVRADICNAIDIRAGLDIDAGEMLGWKQVAPPPRRPVDDRFLTSDLKNRRFGHGPHAVHLLLGRRTDDLDAWPLHGSHRRGRQILRQWPISVPRHLAVMRCT